MSFENMLICIDGVLVVMNQIMSDFEFVSISNQLFKSNILLLHKRKVYSRFKQGLEIFLRGNYFVRDQKKRFSLLFWDLIIEKLAILRIVFRTRDPRVCHLVKTVSFQTDWYSGRISKNLFELKCVIRKKTTKRPFNSGCIN